MSTPEELTDQYIREHTEVTTTKEAVCCYLEGLYANYWDHARDVDSSWRMKGEWVHKLFDVLLKARRLIKTSDSQFRRTVAVWGQSQSGKSTMLGAFLNPWKDENNKWRSPLSWKDGEELWFNSPRSGQHGINPHNAGIDASGCVTRFYLRQEMGLSDMRCKYPVRVELLDQDSALQALAAGYLWETKGAKNERLEDVHSEFPDEVNANDQKLDRKAFEMLFEVMQAVRDFQAMDCDRYRNLDEAKLIEPFIDEPSWLCNIEAATKVSKRILFGNESKLKALLKAMCSSIENYSGQRIYATHRAASVLLNAGAAGKHPSVIRGEEEGHIWLSTQEEGQDGEEIKGDDFLKLQGIVRELRFPINPKNLPSEGAFRDLLGKVDILDFPGIPRVVQGAADKPINLDKVKDSDPYLYHRLVKRGKTLALMLQYCRRAEIAGMVILSKQGDMISQPNILVNAIKRWRTLDPRGDKLPLWVVRTFFQKTWSAVNWRSAPGDVDLGWGDGDGSRLARVRTEEPVLPIGSYPIEIDHPNVAGYLAASDEDRKHYHDSIRKSKEWGMSFPPDYDLKAVFNPKEYGGANSLCVAVSRVLGSFRSIQGNEVDVIRERLEGLVREALSGSANEAKKICAHLKALQENDPKLKEVLKISTNVREMLAIDPGVISVLPRRWNGLERDEQVKFVKKQLFALRTNRANGQANVLGMNRTEQAAFLERVHEQLIEKCGGRIIAALSSIAPDISADEDGKRIMSWCLDGSLWGLIRDHCDDGTNNANKFLGKLNLGVDLHIERVIKPLMGFLGGFRPEYESDYYIRKLERLLGQEA